MVSEKERLDDRREVQFTFSIEEGMGVNTSLSVLLERGVPSVVDITGPGNFSVKEISTSDYIKVAIPGVAEVINATFDSWVMV